MLRQCSCSVSLHSSLLGIKLRVEEEVPETSIDFFLWSFIEDVRNWYVEDMLVQLVGDEISDLVTMFHGESLKPFDADVE